MPKRCPVQLIAVETPLGHEPIHEGREPIAMVPLQQVGQLVDDDILQAGGRFLGQLQVQPDPRAVVLQTPTWFSSASPPCGGLDDDGFFPFFQEKGDLLFQLATMRFWVFFSI
nr:hypothetical protein [Geobacter metallireducens]